MFAALVVGAGLGVATLPVFAPAMLGGVRRVDSRGLRRLQRRVGVPLPDEIRPVVIDRIRFQERGALLGAVTGFLPAVVVSLALADSELLAQLLPLGIGLGAGVGAATAIGRWSRATTGSGSPDARGRTASPLAALSRRFVVSAAVAVVGGLVAGILSVLAIATSRTLHASPSAMAAPVVLALIGTLLAAVVSLVVARAAGRPPRPDGPDLEVAWDDVLRARETRALVLAPVVIAGITGVFAVVNLVDGPAWTPLAVTSGVAGLLAVIAAVVAAMR